MLLNCGVGEDSWESLGLQGDPTSPFWRRSALGFLWKELCWSWNSSTLATSCEELTHWKRLWCWEGLGAAEGDDRGWDGWMASLTRWMWVWVNSGSWWWTGRPGMLWFMGSQSRTWLSDWSDLIKKCQNHSWLSDHINRQWFQFGPQASVCPPLTQAFRWFPQWIFFACLWKSEWEWGKGTSGTKVQQSAVSMNFTRRWSKTQVKVMNSQRAFQSELLEKLLEKTCSPVY